MWNLMEENLILLNLGTAKEIGTEAEIYGKERLGD